MTLCFPLRLIPQLPIVGMLFQKKYVKFVIKLYFKSPKLKLIAPLAAFARKAAFVVDADFTGKAIVRLFRALINVLAVVVGCV